MPKKIEVSIDEVLGTRKDITDDDGVMYKAHIAPRSWDENERSATFIMSAETEDSYRDIVVQSGIDTKSRFEANPVALFGHNSWATPIGSWSDVRRVNGSPKRTEGKMTFTAEGIDDTADKVARHVAAGTLRAASIGFMPKAAERILDEKGEWNYGYRYLEIELYECSLVTVPAVREALIRGAGNKIEDIISPEVVEEFLEHLKANPALAKMIKADLYEQVYREATGNKTASIGSIGINLDVKSLDRLEGIAARMEAAADRVEKGGTLTDDDQVEEIVVDEVAKELSETFESAMVDILPKVDALAEPERKSTLKTLLENVRSGIQSMFKAPDEPEKTDPVIEPEKADAATKEALRKQFDEIAAKYPEAA